MVRSMVPKKRKTARAGTGKTWRTLTAWERSHAISMVQGEQIMWRYGKGTNWHPGSLPDVKRNYRVLGAAVAHLRGRK